MIYDQISLFDITESSDIVIKNEHSIQEYNIIPKVINVEEFLNNQRNKVSK